jgi:glutaminase
LPDGGVNPITKVRVVDPIVCHYTLADMTTAGLYETSGWLYDVGLPGKRGISGEIVTVSPGRVPWELLPRRSTPRATASRDNSASISNIGAAVATVDASQALRTHRVRQ